MNMTNKRHSQSHTSEQRQKKVSRKRIKQIRRDPHILAGKDKVCERPIGSKQEK